MADTVQQAHQIPDLASREAQLIHSSDREDESHSPIPGRYSAITTAALVLFIGVGYTNTFGVFAEYYQSTLFKDQSSSQVILIGSTASSLYLVLGALTGRFADLVGYRPSLLIGSALMIGAMFAASRSTSYTQLWLSQGIMFGLGLAFAYLPAVSVSRQYWGRNHGVANAVIVSGGALGGTVLPYIVRRLIESAGLASTFRILGYIAIVGLLPSVFLLKPVKPTVPIWRRPVGEGRPPILDLSLLHDTRFNALLIASTVAMVGFLPRYFLIPESAVAKGIDQIYASWLLGLMNGVSIIGRIGVGWYADRFGKVSALNMSFILCGLGHVMFWLPAVSVPNGDGAAVMALFTTFVVYTGIFGTGFLSLFPVVVSHLFGSENLASKQGLLNTMTGIGAFVGPSAVYAIVGDGGVKRWALGIISAGIFMMAGGFLLGILLSRPLKLIERTTQRLHDVSGR